MELGAFAMADTDSMHDVDVRFLSGWRRPIIGELFAVFVDVRLRV